jgi:molybdopterin/thiamine biosynthesis adenylyltransferase
VTALGDRHSGTAGGALKLGGKPVSVEIRLGRDAFLAPVQHSAWMLLNILCRLEGVVHSVRLNCASDIALVPKLSPLVRRTGRLADALVDGAHSIGPNREGFANVEAAGKNASDLVISVGFECSPDAAFSAAGNGFCGGIFTRPVTTPARYSDLTIGPYIAACLAASEIFRLVRLRNFTPERQLFLDAIDYTHGADPAWRDLDVAGEFESVLLVGVGAVGSALLHALYPLPLRGALMAADNDPKGVDKTNLARYPLFGWGSLGKAKASEAAALLHAATFQLVPHDGSFEHFVEGTNKPQIVISAVDKNTARHALQEQYAPLILSGSTYNLRAEVLRCGPPSVGACLACFNPLEIAGRTEEEIRSLLDKNPDVVGKLCEKLRLNVEDVAAWMRDRKCSQTGDRLVEELRTDDDSIPAFAVGFVSVLAGTLLAAELLKTLSPQHGPLDESRNRAVFQFQNPSAATNRALFYPRDPGCTTCAEENIGAQIWRRRHEQFVRENRS